VGLTPEEMASEEKRAANAQIRAEVAADLVRGQQQAASTDMFKCVCWAVALRLLLLLCCYKRGPCVLTSANLGSCRRCCWCCRLQVWPLQAEEVHLLREWQWRPAMSRVC
jgi:hypothetical protein